MGSFIVEVRVPCHCCNFSPLLCLFCGIYYVWSSSFFFHFVRSQFNRLVAIFGNTNDKNNIDSEQLLKDLGNRAVDAQESEQRWHYMYLALFSLAELYWFSCSYRIDIQANCHSGFWRWFGKCSSWVARSLRRALLAGDIDRFMKEMSWR